MIVHVDNCYTLGNAPALKLLERELSSIGLKVKVSNLATEYLSCDLKIDPVKQIAWGGQTTIMRKTINKFQRLIKDSHYRYKTPGAPKQQVMRPAEDDETVSPQQQALYQSAVGTFLQNSNKTRIWPTPSET
jgi:hypothetical protein